MTKLVKIEWTDAWSVDSWKTIAELANEESWHCTTIGLLVHETAEFYYVTHTISGDEICCTIVIPKGMVTSLTDIPLPQGTL